MSHPWQNDLFSCFSATEDCLIGCLLPCITYSETEQRLNNASPTDFNADGHAPVDTPCLIFCVAAHLTCGISAYLQIKSHRTKIRQRLGIQGEEGNDWLASICCATCTVCQSQHELKDAQGQVGVYSNLGGMAAPQQPQAMQEEMKYGA